MTTLVLSSAATEAIRLYQRFISPYKGFRCANRADNGQRWSCSEYGRRVFARYPVSTAYALLHRRFEACKSAYGNIKFKRAGKFAAMAAASGTAVATSPPAADDGKKKSWTKRDTAECGLNACDCAGRPPSIDIGTCTTPDIGVCDCSI